MAGAVPLPAVLRFDRFEIDVRAGQLSKSGVKISLREKSFQVLLLLIENAGEVVTREELRERLWPDDVFLDFDNNLNTAVASLRQALHDSADHPRFIETLPRRGYRFLVTASQSALSPRRISAQRVRILVLPFLNLSGDPTQQYLCDALTEELITSLAGMSPELLAIIARTTAMYYKDKHKDVAHIGRELAVDYVVEGGIRSSGDQVGINIQLIQTSDQTHLFAKKYDAAAQELFQLPDCMAQAIATHVPETAGKVCAAAPPQDRAARKPTEDLVAYNFYLMGRQQIQQCCSEPLMVMAKSKKYYEDAIVHDPRFALAHTGLAEWYWWNGFLGLGRPKESFSAGVRAALHASEIDPNLGFPHALLGTFRSRLDYDWTEAGREMALALQLDPGSPDVRFRYAEGYLLPQGRIQEAIIELERALEYDPLSVYARFWLGFALYCGRDYARALEQFRFLMELAPDQHSELMRALDLGYAGLGLVRAAEGRLGEAVAAYRKALELSYGQSPVRMGLLAAALARNGNTAEARTLLQSAEAMAVESYFPATSLAWIHFGLGDIGAGFTWLERAVDESDPAVVDISSYPGVEPLRAHPRFTALLRRMNLQP